MIKSNIDKDNCVNSEINLEWSKAETLIQTNLDRILKKYDSRDSEKFIEDLIQIPKPNQKDGFYLSVYKINFKKPLKSKIIFDPFYKKNMTIKEINDENGDCIIGNAIIKIIESLEKDKRPLNLTRIECEWYGNEIRNFIAVLYQPLYCNNNFNKKSPFYILTCSFPKKNKKIPITIEIENINIDKFSSGHFITTQGNSNVFINNNVDLIEKGNFWEVMAIDRTQNPLIRVAFTGSPGISVRVIDMTINFNGTISSQDNTTIMNGSPIIVSTRASNNIYYKLWCVVSSSNYKEFRLYRNISQL